jgi:hypothetical protein
MEEPNPIAVVTRVLRHDTLQARVWMPLIQSRCTVHITPAGVWCDDTAKDHIVDWVELHADAERIRLVPFDYLRDEYGRLIADLADIQTGECLSEYLINVGAAKPRPHHLMEALHALVDSREVDDVGG